MGVQKYEEADQWKDFQSQFKQLAAEEEKIVREGRRYYLQAAYTYGVSLPVTRKSEPGDFCPFPAPECGLWRLGGVNENFQERFQTLAAHAGTALKCPQDTDPLNFWLHRLLLYLREIHSEELLIPMEGVLWKQKKRRRGEKPLGATKEGMILRVCVASDTFCSRLVREARGTSKTTPAVTQEKTVPGGQWFDSAPDILRRRQIVLRNPKMFSKSLCKVFDNTAPPIPLPRDWPAELSVDTWSKAYENETGRNRIQKIISTDRRTEKPSSS